MVDDDDDDVGDKHLKKKLSVEMLNNVNEEMNTSNTCKNALHTNRCSHANKTFNQTNVRKKWEVLFGNGNKSKGPN